MPPNLPPEGFYHRPDFPVAPEHPVVDDRTVQPHTLPLAPTQPPGPQEYDGPEYITRGLEQDVGGRRDSSAIIDRLLQLDRAPKHDFPIFFPVGGNTDSNGNATMLLYTTNQQQQVSVHNVMVFPTDPATYNPAAPFANAAAYAYLAIGTAGSTGTNYQGMIAFAPTSAGGPILPGNWTWGTHDSPKLYGGQSLFLVVVGTAAIANMALQTRVGLRRRATP